MRRPSRLQRLWAVSLGANSVLSYVGTSLKLGAVSFACIMVSFVLIFVGFAIADREADRARVRRQYGEMNA